MNNIGRKRCVFRNSLFLFSFSAFEPKFFLIQGKFSSKVLKNAFYLSRGSFWKFFFQMKHRMFQFSLEFWQKIFRFWEKNIARIVKYRCPDEKFGEKSFFLIEKLQNFFWSLIRILLEIGKTISTALSQQYSTFLEEHCKEKCLAFEE